jgi:cytoskeleton protein RodZ
MSEQESVVQESSLPTPGQLLREARQAKGLSLEQVANKINLRAHNIEAIENDEDDSNLSATFTKGYLKVYAKFVDVSEPDILEAYERINSVDKEPAKLQSFSRRVAKQTNDARLMMLTYFIIAIVIALSVLWWFQQSEEAPVVQSPISTPPVEQSTTDTVNDTPLPSNQTVLVEESTINVDEVVDSNLTSTTVESLSDEADTINNVEALVGEAIDGLTTEQPSVPDIAEADQELVDGEVGDAALLAEVQDTRDSQVDNEFDSFAAPVELVFEFSDDCWMNLVDATGEAIAYGVKASGRVMTVSGVPPFEVTLGAPQVVQISMAGDAVDMSQFPAGRTAKFELPLQE